MEPVPYAPARVRTGRVWVTIPLDHLRALGAGDPDRVAAEIRAAVAERVERRALTGPVAGTGSDPVPA